MVKNATGIISFSSMRCRVGASIVISIFLVFVACLAPVWFRVDDIFKEPNPPLNFNDKSCMLVGADLLASSEDLAQGRGGILFITSGDLGVTFTKGAAAATPGAMFALDLRASVPDVLKLPINGFPQNVAFQPHGIYVSNITDRLLVVSHRGNHSAIEVLSVKYHDKCMQARPWACTPVTLTYVRSVTSPHFPNYGINDVVEGADDNELYVSQWLGAPFPEHGMLNPRSFIEHVVAMLPLWVPIVARTTSVFKCDINKNECVSALPRKFYSANGMTVSEDRKTVFVNDVLDKKITVMTRAADGFLEETGHIDLPYVVDNIEMENGDIVMGTIPDFGKICDKVIGKNVVVPGGLAIAVREGDEWKVVTGALEHDGRKLSMISAAARYGKRVVLGSPNSNGVLVCN